MPPVVLWALGVVGTALVGRVLAQHARRVSEELDALRAEAKAGPVDRREVPTLKRDPATGEYRPTRRR